MFKPEKLEDMSPEKKIETTDALNTIAEEYTNQYAETLASINKEHTKGLDVVAHALKAKEAILTSDIKFQSQLIDRMIDSTRKINNLEYGDSQTEIEELNPNSSPTTTKDGLIDF